MLTWCTVLRRFGALFELGTPQLAPATAKNSTNGFAMNENRSDYFGFDSLMGVLN
jgi:hypothetical protein